jgi:predicted lipoprotein with Yx(FWY)xxD motif
MLRKHVVSLAVFVAAGAAMLSACGSQDLAQGNPVPAASNAADSTPLNLLQGTGKSNNAAANTGDWAPAGAPASVAQKWVQLTASKAGNLNPVIVDGKGMTLYRFDNDTSNPPKSNCNGDCAKTWPPVEIAPGGKIFIAGVKKADVGVVKRDDGYLQVTIKGHAIYRFNKDTKPGDTKGQGVGGTWFGVQPNGEKSGVGTGTTTAPPTGSGSAALSATSAILFDDANFSDNGASQGVTGPDCQAVPRPRVASSITTDGTLKLWTGPNCTGQSVVINGDVANLGDIGFDNAILSLRFAPSGTAPSSTQTSTPNAGGGATTLTATSAILDSGKNLSEPDGSQGIGGPGCQNVGNPKGVSSIQASGTYKIWTGADCTGKSMIVTGNQLDLGPIGFDKAVASIRFAG